MLDGGENRYCFLSPWRPAAFLCALPSGALAASTSPNTKRKNVTRRCWNPQNQQRPNDQREKCKKIKIKTFLYRVRVKSILHHLCVILTGEDEEQDQTGEQGRAHPGHFSTRVEAMERKGGTREYKQDLMWGGVCEEEFGRWEERRSFVSGGKAITAFRAKS